MFSIKNPAAIFALIALAAFLIASFRIPPGGSDTGLSFLMEPDGTGVWRDLVDRFNRTHGAAVRLVEGPPATNTREDMYATAFLGGLSGYDIVYSDVVWVPKFAAAGWLLDLTDRLQPADRADFLPADLQAGIYRGRLYRLPAVTDAALLYYRTDIAPRPPRTFQELSDLAAPFHSQERWGFLWQGKQYEGLITVYLEILWGYGGDWITADRQVRLDSDEAVAALEFLKSTIGTISPPGVTTYTEEETRTLFQNGRGVFLRNWLYVWALAERPGSEVRGKVGFVPMVHAPGRTGAATLGGWGFSISKQTRNPDAAWAFVKFVTDPEQLATIHERTGLIPARTSLVPPEFREIFQHARSRPLIPEYAQASDILQRWLSAALAGATAPHEALHAAARETRALLGEPAPAAGKDRQP
jgi:trehalose/maltose transport system substrate-binding protein